MSDGDLELRVAWHHHVGRDGAADEHLESVLARYREPHRHYHTVRHLTWVVRHVTSLATGRGVDLDDLGAVVAAAFYHDVIYDPRAADNEAASASLARAALGELGWADRRTDAVARMILGTVDHDLHLDRGGIDLDQAVLQAADLGVLAAEPARYGDYVRNVRREYAHVADDQWAIGRAEVLRAFIDRPAIFDPRLDLDGWEARARGNLAAELRQLAS